MDLYELAIGTRFVSSRSRADWRTHILAAFPEKMAALIKALPGPVGEKNLNQPHALALLAHLLEIDQTPDWFVPVLKMMMDTVDWSTGALANDQYRARLFHNRAPMVITALTEKFEEDLEKFQKGAPIDRAFFHRILDIAIIYDVDAIHADNGLGDIRFAVADLFGHLPLELKEEYLLTVTYSDLAAFVRSAAPPVVDDANDIWTNLLFRPVDQRILKGIEEKLDKAPKPRPEALADAFNDMFKSRAPNLPEILAFRSFLNDDEERARFVGGLDAHHHELLEEAFMAPRVPLGANFDGSGSNSDA